MQERLFRKEALDRLSSPEELDQLMQITSPRSWLALLAIILLIIAGIAWGVWGSIAETTSGEGILIRGGIDTISAPISGRLDDIYIRLGDSVEQGQVIARVLPTNSDELVRVESNSNGRVIGVRVAAGNFVQIGEPLVNLEPTGDVVQDIEAILFLPAAEGKKVRPGMKVQVIPTTVRAEETGVMLGWVRTVSEFPESQESLRRVLENDDLVTRFFEITNNAPIQVRVDLVPARDSVSGYKWSSPEGAKVDIQSGTLFDATIILDEKPPIELIFPFLARN